VKKALDIDQAEAQGKKEDEIEPGLNHGIEGRPVESIVATKPCVPVNAPAGKEVIAPSLEEHIVRRAGCWATECYRAIDDLRENGEK